MVSAAHWVALATCGIISPFLYLLTFKFFCVHVCLPILTVGYTLPLISVKDVEFTVVAFKNRLDPGQIVVSLLVMLAMHAVTPVYKAVISDCVRARFQIPISSSLPFH